jgi:hypothetical protein
MLIVLALSNNVKLVIMKRIWLLALLVMILLFTGTCGAKIPNLIGKWSGLESWYGEVNGSTKLTENESLNVTVTEQKNRLFTGYLTYTSENGTESSEGFAGVIGMDNKTLYLAEFNEGYDFGTIISDDEMEFIYLQDGKNALATLDRLHRINS